MALTVAIADRIDAVALRETLTAFAQAEPDKAKLRAKALALIKAKFQEARTTVRADVESGVLQGQEAAQALSAIQDSFVQVLYDFATKHFYYAQNPTASEHLAIVATGGYGPRRTRTPAPTSTCCSCAPTNKRHGRRALSSSCSTCSGILA
ncbi:MAG: hypothetical protein WDM89_13785 [Rhizomicrobium sp.]